MSQERKEVKVKKGKVSFASSGLEKLLESVRVSKCFLAHDQLDQTRRRW